MRIRRKKLLYKIIVLHIMLILITGCNYDEMVSLNFDTFVDEDSGTINTITVTIHNYGGDIITDLTLVHSSDGYSLTDNSEFTIIYQMSNISIVADSDVVLTISQDDINEYLIANSVKLMTFEGYVGVILHMDAFLQDDTEGKTGFISSCYRNQFYIICNDDNEANNTPGSAAPLPEYAIGNSIFPGSDIDWFSFEATGSQTYNISTDWLITFYPSDTHIELYNDPFDPPIESSNNDLGFDDISGWTAPATGTYYLKIKDENSEIGTYSLMVE